MDFCDLLNYSDVIYRVSESLLQQYGYSILIQYTLHNRNTKNLWKLGWFIPKSDYRESELTVTHSVPKRSQTRHFHGFVFFRKIDDDYLWRNKTSSPNICKQSEVHKLWTTPGLVFTNILIHRIFLEFCCNFKGNFLRIRRNSKN